MTETQIVVARDMPPARPRSEDEGPWGIVSKSWIRLARAPESPLLQAPEPAVTLAVARAKLEHDLLALRVLVTVKLPGEILFGYRRVGKAVIVTVHDCCGEQIGHFSMLDGHKTFPRVRGDNYRGPSELPAGGMMVTQYFDVDVSFPVRPPAEAEAELGASVVLLASVHRLRSQPVTIDLSGPEPTIEPEAVVSELPEGDDEDEAPKPEETP